MNVGIIGTGSMGSVLARHLVGVGHDVAMAGSRGPEAIAAQAAEIRVKPASLAEAIEVAQVIILAIPTKAVTALPKELFTRLPRDRIVIDVGNYHPELRDGPIDAIDRGMLDSQWVSQQLGHPVIKVFNNILASSLLDKGAPKGAPGRIALPVAGDSPGAKAAVLQLVDELGFDAVDNGALDNSWRQATGTPAYCKDLDAVALRRALALAQRHRVAKYRAEREAWLRSGEAT